MEKRTLVLTKVVDNKHGTPIGFAIDPQEGKNFYINPQILKSKGWTQDDYGVEFTAFVLETNGNLDDHVVYIQTPRPTISEDVKKLALALVDLQEQSAAIVDAASELDDDLENLMKRYPVIN